MNFGCLPSTLLFLAEPFFCSDLFVASDVANLYFSARGYRLVPLGLFVKFCCKVSLDLATGQTAKVMQLLTRPARGAVPVAGVSFSLFQMEKL